MAAERPLGAFAVLGAASAVEGVAGVAALVGCVVLSSFGAAALLGLRAAVPRVAVRLVVALGALLAGVAAGVDSAGAVATGVAATAGELEEISFEAAAVFLLLAVAGLVALPALRLVALAVAAVLEAEVLGAEAGADEALVAVAS